MSGSKAMIQSTSVALPGGGQAPLRVRRSRRAQRLALRIMPASGEVELVVPIRASVKQGIAFAREKAGWLKAHLGKLQAPVPFEHGALIPVLDQPRRIHRTDELFDGVWLTDNELVVAGAPEIVPLAVRAWLRKYAREELIGRAEEKSGLLNSRFRRLTVRDTASRWGSCSPKGDLSFSWRIIMAPDYALDYLVAHEVAHLREMNHSRRFWAIVDDIADQPDLGRAWLRDHGAALHRFGVEARSPQAL
jgi:predicted metal-dependent hydrolase